MCSMQAFISNLKEMEFNHQKMCPWKGRPTKLKCHRSIIRAIALCFIISIIVIQNYIMTQFLTAPDRKLYTIRKCSNPHCFNAAISTCVHPQILFQCCISTYVHPQFLISHKPTIISQKKNIHFQSCFHANYLFRCYLPLFVWLLLFVGHSLCLQWCCTVYFSFFGSSDYCAHVSMEYNQWLVHHTPELYGPWW